MNSATATGDQNGSVLQPREDFVYERNPAEEKWFRRSKVPLATMRLFAFPYAGGSARVFREWHEWFAPDVEVVAIELPGRGIHVRSPAVDSMEALMERLLTVLDPLLDLPFAFFGHSLGALIAFELSRTLMKTGHRTPLHLFVSGMRAPHLLHVVRAENQVHNLPDLELIDALRALNGTPAEVLEDSGLIELFLPILRADLRLAETYLHTLSSPLKHPITVFGGLQDKTAPTECLHEWTLHTSSVCTVCLLEGDHFFIHQMQHIMAASILKTLGKTPLPVELDSPSLPNAQQNPPQAAAFPLASNGGSSVALL
ncbi:MAG TPA: alpha/beta fold hydrolase [Candidatus Angelobacter sp.]|nr:alpha/beta fold hydrolase [Candidatus Angelobacter sp.]